MKMRSIPLTERQWYFKYLLIFKIHILLFKNSGAHTMTSYSDIFTEDTMTKLFPAGRADKFFDAIFGDAEEGAFDISVRFRGFNQDGNELLFEIELHERPGKCLACNLTYGLPEVFSRHPLINIKGFVNEVASLLGEEKNCADWRLGTTNQVSGNLHTIPLFIKLGSLRLPSK